MVGFVRHISSIIFVVAFLFLLHITSHHISSHHITSSRPSLFRRLSSCPPPLHHYFKVGQAICKRTKPKYWHWAPGVSIFWKFSFRSWYHANDLADNDSIVTCCHLDNFKARITWETMTANLSSSEGISSILASLNLLPSSQMRKKKLWPL